MASVISVVTKRRDGRGARASRASVIFGALLAVLLGPPAVAAPARPQGAEKPAAASPVVWRDPGAVESLDLALGAGGAEGAPVPPFAFVKRVLTGTNPKVEVRDSRGRVYRVKWGPEAQAETFASRLVWACGYFVEPCYFVPSGTIEGAADLGPARRYVRPNGSFADARFELAEEGIEKGDPWRWDQNPFLGTRELAGLKVLVMLTANWDPKDGRSRTPNVAIMRASGGGPEMYAVTDWGASMGAWGRRLTKWDCAGYAAQTAELVRAAKPGAPLAWGYAGTHTADIKANVTADDVRWLLERLGRVSDEQIRAALAASGADASEADCFARAVRDRISALRAAAGAPQH